MQVAQIQQNKKTAEKKREETRTNKFIMMVMMMRVKYIMYFESTRTHEYKEKWERNN